jgi:hypothetical protein
MKSAALMAVLGLVAATALAQAPTSGQSSGTKMIYSCMDERGRRLTADRPIAECIAREQRVLNADGSLREIRPPTLTLQERADQEARERHAAQARAAKAEAEQRDRNLLIRYPDEATHQRARESALATVLKAQAQSQQRLVNLDRERASLLAEVAAQPGKLAPPRVKTLLDANEAARSAQLDASTTQTAEIQRIQRWFDAELQLLRRLWAGAPTASPSSGAAEARSAQPVTTESRRP